MNVSKKSKVITCTLLTSMALYFLSLFIYMLFTAFKTEAETIAHPPKLFPARWLWEDYMSAWKTQPFGRYLLNSVLITAGATAGQVISCSLVAYGFVRYNFKDKNIMLMILLSTMTIPWNVTMIPQYMELKIFGRINTLEPLIIPPWFDSAYHTFLMRQFLIGVPKDFEEAARVNRASAFQVYWRTFMPIMRPQLIPVGMLSMITVRNGYLGSLIFLQDRSKFTLALGPASFKGVHSTQIISTPCITVIVILPSIIVLLLAQKHVVEGTSGAVK